MYYIKNIYVRRCDLVRGCVVATSPLPPQTLSRWFDKLEATKEYCYDSFVSRRDSASCVERLHVANHVPFQTVTGHFVGSFHP